MEIVIAIFMKIIAFLFLSAVLFYLMLTKEPKIPQEIIEAEKEIKKRLNTLLFLKIKVECVWREETEDSNGKYIYQIYVDTDENHDQWKWILVKFIPLIEIPGESFYVVEIVDYDLLNKISKKEIVDIVNKNFHEANKD